MGGTVSLYAEGPYYLWVPRRESHPNNPFSFNKVPCQLAMWYPKNTLKFLMKYRENEEEKKRREKEEEKTTKRPNHKVE